MKIGDYVRTKQREFQYPQIARIKSISRDEGYNNQYFIELDHNLLPDYEYRIYEEDIDKSSPNIIDLIQVGDYVNGYKVIKKNKCTLYIEDYADEDSYLYISRENIKSIVTKEQFKSMEYKVGEDNENESDI